MIDIPNRIRHWRDKRMVLQEVLKCDATERDRLLRELKMTEPELTAIINAGPGDSHLLMRMLDALELDYQRLQHRHPPVASDLRRVCALCDNKQRCRRELEASTAAENFHEFCNNTITLQSLTADPTIAGGPAEREDVSK